MDEMLRTQIILAAVNMTAQDGDETDWAARCRENAFRITALTNPASELSQAIEAMSSAKVFSGVVTQLRKEASSTRAVVTLRTKPNDRHPDGLETVRTDRTDSIVGLRMARRVRGLVGHRVLVWVELEQMARGDNKVRVLRHIEDMGPDTSRNNGATAGAPVAVEA